MFWFSTFLLLMVSIIAFVLLNNFIFRRTDQESSPQAKIFPWSRRYSTSKGFSMINECSMIKEVFHKTFFSWLSKARKFITSNDFSTIRKIFCKQGIFPWWRKCSTTKDLSVINKVFHKQRFFHNQRSFPQTKYFQRSRKFSTSEDFT